MLSTCLIVGGVAAVSGNTPTRPSEVVGIDGVRGASEEIARVDKTKRFPHPAVASDEQEAPSTTPLPAPGPAPAPPTSDNGPVRVPPAAPTPTDARQQALPQPADGGDARRAPAPPPASPSIELRESRGKHEQAPWHGDRRDGGHGDGDRRGHEDRGDDRRGGPHGGRWPGPARARRAWTRRARSWRRPLVAAAMARHPTGWLLRPGPVVRDHRPRFS